MKYAHREWLYDYREIPSVFEENKCGTVVTNMLTRYSKITKSWSPELNSEWLYRAYLAAKLIMQATLTINSMHYAQEKNLRVVVPYLRYYSALSLIRAIVLMLPEAPWNNGRVITLGHEKVLNIAASHIAEFEPNFSSLVKHNIQTLRDSRELISYRAPSSGDEAIPGVKEFLRMCALLAELAQLDSELMETSIKKNADREAFLALPEYLYELSNVSIGQHTFGDIEDAFRLDYFRRKQPHMLNLRFLMRQDHVDDFFGAWSNPQKIEGAFDPDEMIGVIFDIP
jgi:hypothetical protein